MTLSVAVLFAYKWLHNFLKALDEILKEIQTDLIPFVGSLEPLNHLLHFLLLIFSKYPLICVQICFIMANGCIIRQLIVSSHASIIVLLKFVC